MSRRFVRPSDWSQSTTTDDQAQADGRDIRASQPLPWLAQPRFGGAFLFAASISARAMQPVALVA